MKAESKPSFSPKVRLGLSILVIGHLLAVVTPPLSFQARGVSGVSPAVASLMRPTEGYGQFLYLDRGYAFFAPDPGPSHLFQAAITSQDGTRRELMFPDLDQHWPRLLYHRHFMLSEYLNEIYEPPGPPPELARLDAEAAEYWTRSRARYEHVRQSIVRHLESEYPGQSVAVRRIEHLIPDAASYTSQSIALNDPASYRVLLDLPIDASEQTQDLIAPAGPPESVPVPAESEQDDAKDGATE